MYYVLLQGWWPVRSGTTFRWLWFGSSAACPILLGQLQMWQNWHGMSATCGIPKTKSTKCSPRSDGSPCAIIALLIQSWIPNETLICHFEPPLHSKMELEINIGLLTTVIMLHVTLPCVTYDLKLRNSPFSHILAFYHSHTFGHLNWAYIFKVLKAHIFLSFVELEINHVGIISPGAIFQSTILLSPKIIKVGISAQSFQVGVGHYKYFSIWIDESLAQCSTFLIPIFRKNGISPEITFYILQSKFVLSAYLL